MPICQLDEGDNFLSLVGAGMSRSKDDWINQRAYALWEAEGRPAGRSDHHWQQAASEYKQLELTRASEDGSDLIERLQAMGRLMRSKNNGGVVATTARDDLTVGERKSSA